MEISKAIEIVLDATYSKALEHTPFTSNHEAYGVLLEEVAEYFDCIREKKPDKAHCVEELADIAAVCMKALMQLCTDS